MEDSNDASTRLSDTFKDLQWSFEGYYKTKAYLIQVEPERREVIVFIPDRQLMLIADVAPYLNMKKLVVGRSYEMEFIVYSAKVGRRLKENLMKTVEKPYLKDSSRYRRAYNIRKLKPLEKFFLQAPKLYRFELIKVIDVFYSRLIKQKFEYSVLRSFKGPAKFRWRHLLGF